MKNLFKSSFMAIAAVVLSFCACTEPAEEAPAQVYFPKENGGRVEIAIDAMSFDVALNRVGEGASASVPVTVMADSLAAAWFEFPAVAEFANASKSAVYTVTLKEGAVLEYDRFAKITLSIAGEYAAALGNALYSFEVGVPASWSEWEKVGEGTYYPSVYWSGEQEGLSVYYRECLVNDADAQYCIQGIGNTMNLTVEFDRQTGACQVLPQYAATNYKYGQVTVSDVLHSPLSDVESTYEEYPCTYDAERGLFTFNLAYIVSTQWGGNADESFGCGIEKFQLDGFEVDVPEPWSEWEKMGEGTYYPSVYWSGEQEGLSVYYRECLANETDAQFCIQGIENTMNLTVEYDRLTGACQVLPQYAATNYKYGQVTVSDVLHSPLSDVESTYEEYPCTYDAERGLFTFNLAYIVSTQWGGNADESFGCGIEKFQLDGFVKLDADYSFAMQFRGHYIDADGVDNAVISVSKGADVGGCLMAVVAADNNTDATVQGMLAGNVPCDTLIAGGFYACPMTASGNYKAVAITYNADGELIETHTVEFEFWVAADSNPWKSLGYAKYTDDVIAPLLGAAVPAYYVQVLESKGQPGLFRLVDPYGPLFPMYQSAESYKDGSYIEIDATDPQGVWIVGWQSTGFNILDKGLVSITSSAWYQANELGATKDEVKEAGYCGTYANGVITFPANGIFAAIGDKAYYANRNAAFALDMTDMLESLPAEAAASRSIAARMMMEIKAKTMGHVARFKKIDNSFLTPQQ